MSKDNVSELIQKNSSSSRNSSQLPHTENHQRKHQQHQHQQNQQHSQNFGLTHFTSMTNKKFLFRSHRTLSTCLPDEMPSKSLNTTHNSLDIHCSNDDNHIKTIKPRVLMSQSSFELITDKSIHNVDEVSEKKQDEIHWDYSSSYCSGNINVTSALNTSPINISPSDYNSSTSSRNILRRQHQQQEQQCTVETSPPLHTSSSISNENTAGQYVSSNSLKKWKTLKSEHSKDQQSSDSSHTVHKPTNNNDSTVTHTGQFSRPGFLRHPLRKAMSYVKPQPEPSVSVKSTTRRLQHTLTIERPDDRKFKPMSSKTSNRSSLRASANQSDFSNKASSPQSPDYQHAYNYSDRSLFPEVYSGDSSDLITSKQTVKYDLDRKAKQKDIRHLNDLLANLLSKSFSNAFKRPVGKSKSASPTTDIDNTTNNNNKCNDSFKFDTREVEGCQENLVVNEHIPTRSQLHQWEQSFDKLLADTDGLTQFHQFLKSEYSEENIEFWVICELYKHLPASLLSEESQKIYKLYLAPHSPREVNLDSETRNRTISGLSNPTNESFVIAQQTIQGLMNKDSYQRFLRSSFYFDLKQLVWDTHSSGDLLTVDESLSSSIKTESDSDIIKSNYEIEHPTSIAINPNNECCSYSEESRIKDIPISLPSSDIVIESPEEPSVSNGTDLECYQQNTVLSSPELDQSLSCSLPTALYVEDLEKYGGDDVGDNNLIHDPSVEPISPISPNDEHLLQEIPSSVSTEAAPHSPELSSAGGSLLFGQEDNDKLKQNISTNI